ETPGVYVPGDDLLLWQNPAWRIQGQAENFTQETEAVARAVYRLDTAIPQPPPHGRTAATGAGAGGGASELLCHYGQLRELLSVYASDAPGALQMAQSSQPTQVIHLGGFPTGPAACRLASGARSGQPEPCCHTEWFNGET